MAPSVNRSENVPVTTTAATTRPHPDSAVLKRRRLGATGAATDAVSKPEAKDTDEEKEAMSWTARNQWVVYAVASGACAAFNGVFAKLTTNDLTAHIAQGISGLLGLEGMGHVLEIGVRIMFFALNLVFNGVMWTLFTQALAKGNSTTQVSIMNTSTNFVITALLGLAIFAESLPPLWWAGATLLVAGNVIIGRKNEGEDADGECSDEEAAEQGLGGASISEYKDDVEDDDVAHLT